MMGQTQVGDRKRYTPAVTHETREAEGDRREGFRVGPLSMFAVVNFSGLLHWGLARFHIIFFVFCSSCLPLQ